MIINIVSNLNEKAKFTQLYAFNHVVAWSLRNAFNKKGIKTRLVRDRTICPQKMAKATHTIVISNVAIKRIRDCLEYRRKIRKATKKKLCLYLDSDYGTFHKYFDYIMSVVRLRKKNKNAKYVYVGWGADPKFFYPAQKGKALFLDRLMYDKYGGRFNDIYKVIEKVMKKPRGIKVYNPLSPYNKMYDRSMLDRSQLQKIMRKCHFYLCTQYGESGLMRIEAATCGAMLVVPKRLYRPRTMDSLEHRIWKTKKDLVQILQMKTNPKIIRRKALKHSWGKVASRILKTVRK